jgi:misacylated tRNA(Ala) deacylase
MAAATTRLYLSDPHVFEADATVVAVGGDALACDRTCFYPGGGGQPPDRGTVIVSDGGILPIVSAHADGDGIVWHFLGGAPSPALVGASVRLVLDRERRLALARSHTALHVLNTTARRDHGAWITGVQIGVEHSRIDFKLDGWSPAMAAELEAKVNAVLAADLALRSYDLGEEEFRGRDDLLRTLEAKPPVVNGRVRVVEIEGFDAQACGGTHVRRTSEIGRVSIYRTENKGALNKRLYLKLGGAEMAPQTPQGGSRRPGGAETPADTV